MKREGWRPILSQTLATVDAEKLAKGQPDTSESMAVMEGACCYKDLRGRACIKPQLSFDMRPHGWTYWASTLQSQQASGYPQHSCLEARERAVVCVLWPAFWQCWNSSITFGLFENPHKKPHYPTHVRQAATDRKQQSKTRTTYWQQVRGRRQGGDRAGHYERGHSLFLQASSLVLLDE